jgi:hypothetical protein
MAFEVSGAILAEGLVSTVATDAAFELMPLAMESLAPEVLGSLAPEAFSGFGGETLSSLFGSEMVPTAIKEAATPMAESALTGGAGAGEGITAATKGAVETGATLPEASTFAQGAPQFSPEELNAINQGTMDAASSGPSPYEPTASTGQSPLVEKAPTGTENLGQGFKPTMPNTTGTSVGLNPATPTPSPFTAPPAPSSLANLAPPTDTGFMQGFSNFVDKHPFMTGAGIYGIANATGLLNQKPQTFGNQNTSTYNSPYKFDAKNFKGSHPNSQQYKVDYSGYPGYKGYAVGGITQASPQTDYSTGGSAPLIGTPAANTTMDSTVGNNSMFPMSEMDRSYYATPTQLPAGISNTKAPQTPQSMAGTMGGYETKVDPYAGTMSMAAGGQVPGYSTGGSLLQALLDKYNQTGEKPTQDQFLEAQGLHSSFNPEYAFDKANAKFVPMPSMEQYLPAPKAPAPSNDSGGGYAGGSMPNELKYASGGIAHYYRGDLATSTGQRGDVYGATQRFLDMYDPASRYEAPSGTPDVGIFHDTNPATRDKSAYQASGIRNKAIANKAMVKTGANYMAPSRQMGQINLNTPNAKADDTDSDQVLTGASGGIMGASLGGYAAGGNPRLLKGPGDGMSDNIPATIGGRQPARLADGEFVVPADVVSHLGNGSTDAGAKRLHEMMDKVRMERTGKKKQAPAVKANKYIPK